MIGRDRNGELDGLPVSWSADRSGSGEGSLVAVNRYGFDFPGGKVNMRPLIKVTELTFQIPGCDLFIFYIEDEKLRRPAAVGRRDCSTGIDLRRWRSGRGRCRRRGRRGNRLWNSFFAVILRGKFAVVLRTARG